MSNLKAKIIRHDETGIMNLLIPPNLKLVAAESPKNNQSALLK